jgi:hypothetical protein
VGTANYAEAQGDGVTETRRRDAASPLLEFWARLDQPELGDAIALLRERFGLSRAELIQRMWNLSPQEDLGVDESLVYRWERGEHGRSRPRPRPRYRALLGRVCESEVSKLNPMARRDFLRRLAALAGPPLVLGAASPSLLLSADNWSAAPQSLDLAAAEMAGGDTTAGLMPEDIVQLTAHYERLRRRVSGRHLIGPVRAHLDFVTRYLRESSQPAAVRLSLVSALGEAAVLAGRLSFWDMHDEPAARHHFEMATAAAHEAEDRALAAYALAFTAELATYIQQPGLAAGRSRAAQELAVGSTSPRVRSWLAAVEAEANANIDDVEGCLRALERAREAMAEARPGDADPQWIEFFDGPRLQGYEGACLARIGHSRPALQVLGRAAASTNPALKRYHAEITSDTAWALAQEGEIEESSRLLVVAFDHATSVGYRDGVRRVLNVRRQLEPHNETQAVQELDEQLRFGWMG